MTKEELLKVKQDLLNLETLKLSGYPTIDKPWTINYNQKELEKEIPKRTVFQEIYNNNLAFPKDLALEFLNISREIESKLTGKLYKTGEMVSRSTDIQPQVAIMYTRTFSDESYENIVYYNCKLAKTDESTGTTTDGIEFKITTFDGKASPLSNGDIKYVISSDEVGEDNTASKKKLDNFFKTVQFFDKEDTTLE